tara:strand:+ start:71242 stop:71814 length:573 start_codon:yes stop_codon:yes gene_type:complete
MCFLASLIEITTKPCFRSLNPKSSVLNHQKGFTLIEILIVVVIIGIMATVSVLSVVNAGEAQKLRSSVNAFENRVNFAQQQALLRNDLFGLNISQKGYEFEIFIKIKNHWQWQILKQPKAILPQAWPKKVSIQLAVDNSQMQLVGDNFADAPQIKFFPSGQMTNFHVIINNKFYVKTTNNGVVKTGFKND